MNTYHQVQDIIRTLRSPKTSMEPIAPLAEHTWSNQSEDIYDYVTSISHACEQASLSMGVPVVIAIVDASGNLIYMKRLKGALLVSNEIAPAKAYTAVAFQMSTAEVAPLVREGAPFAGIESMVSHKIATFGGGVPLMVGNELIGALGISGGTVEQDIAIAEIGKQAIQIDRSI